MKNMKAIAGLVLAVSLAAAPMMPVAAAEQLKDTVQVNGSSTSTVTADEAQFQFTLTDSAQTQEDAQASNTARVNQALAYLASVGVSSEDVTTVSYYVWPDYNWDGSDYVVTGYEATSVIEVSRQPIALAGHLLTGLGQLGVDQISSLSYTASGYDAAYEEALKEAVGRARKKAETLAVASGRKLGSVVVLTENSTDATAQNTSARLMTAEAASDTTAPDVPLEPEEIPVDAEVTVTFSLK